MKVIHKPVFPQRKEGLNKGEWQLSPVSDTVPTALLSITQPALDSC